MATTKLNNGQLPDTIQNKTIDTSNDIDTTTTKLTISGGSNGQVLSTDGSGNLSWTTAGGGGTNEPAIIVVKSADETVTSSTTLQDDDHLTCTLDANSYYFGELQILFSRTNTTSTNGPRSGGNAGSLGYITTSRAQGATLLDGTSSTTDNVLITTGSNVVAPLKLFVTVLTGGSTQTFTFKWAQNANNATGVKIHKGSRLVLWKTATA